MKLISNASYKVTLNFIDRRFKKANLKLYTLDTDKYTIEYWDNQLEDKPVFLILHGLGAKTRYQWHDQLSALRGKYRILMPNLLHFGGSVPKSKKFGVMDQVEMIEYFIDKMGIDRYTLMGASYGGLISAELANRKQGQIERLFLVDAVIKYIYATDEQRVCKAYNAPSVPDLFVPNTAAGFKRLIAATVGVKGWKPPTMTLQKFLEELYLCNYEDKRMIVYAMMSIREEFESHEYKFTMPTHLIWGEYDVLVPPERGILLKEHIGDVATIDIIKNGGHMPNMNKPRVFNKLLLKYLES